jgi:ferredoxin-NADP reductase
MLIPPQSLIRPYRVTSNAEAARGIFALTLEPADPENRIPSFEAGQWVYLQLSDGIEPLKRPYSMASPPFDVERDHRILLCIKILGGFTGRAHALKAGDEAGLQGPFGAFTLRAQAPRSVFFAGGIGITPIRSMIRQAHRANPSMDITLFYSCRAEEERAFADEFRILDARLDAFRLITRPPCVTDPSAPGGFGRVDAEFIDASVREYADTEFYLCGPADFMDKLVSFLHTRGVAPGRIHTERFG